MKQRLTAISLLIMTAFACHKEPEPIIEPDPDPDPDPIEVVDHGDSDTKVLKFDLLTFDRGLVRHDPKKIAKVLESIL